MRYLLALAFVLSLNISFSQDLPIPRNIKAAYDKGTRSKAGMPGKNYWQNTADYQMAISFDPSSRLLSGVETIHYLNNSPDTLKQIWFKLYPNLYQKGTEKLSNIAAADLTDGVVIDSAWLGGKLIDRSQISINGTNMFWRRTSVLPRSGEDLRISWHYTVNAGSHIRTGQVDTGAFFLSYFFPRVAVYDDIDGWNKLPYLGTQEFYNDFANFDVRITLPPDMLAWATGDLRNCNEVFLPEYCNRIARAEQSDEVVDVIDSTDLSKKITVDAPSHTWHFQANKVTDFAFAISNHYLWKSASLVVDPLRKRRTRVDAVFNQSHRDYFQVVNDARRTVEVMSYIFPKWPFPYNHETVFDGLDQMEYPMMVNDNPVEDRAESIELTDHEIFHTMFPFYLGINETKYGWMDEGWATIGEWLVSPLIDSTIVDEYGVRPYELNAGGEQDPPITTLTTQLNGTSMFLNSYPKPAFGYLYVKDLLGDSLFTKALHHYIATWQGRHPLPLDFFNSMNKGSGRNLNWFWQKWFYDPGYPDLALTKVTATATGADILITLVGSKPVPVDLKLYYTDGTMSTVHRSIGVWENKKQNATLKLTVKDKRKISKIVMGDPHTPDIDHSNNTWTPSN